MRVVGKTMRGNTIGSPAWLSCAGYLDYKNRMAAVTSEPLRVIVIGGSPVGLELKDLKHLGQSPARVVAGAFGDFTDADVLTALDAEADLAIVCDAPKLDRIVPTIRHLMLRKIPVVCDSGDMTWPWLKTPHLADVLGNEAQRTGVAVVGVGNDPAAVEMVLPLIKTEANLSKVTIGRHLIGEAKQFGYQKTAEEFRKLAKAGVVGLLGVGEMVALIAQALGRHPMRAEIRAVLRPTLNDQKKVIGLRQTCAYSSDGLEIEVEHVVDLVGAADGVSDTLEIAGTQTRTLKLPANNLARTLPAIAARLPGLAPGLYTPLDLFK